MRKAVLLSRIVAALALMCLVPAASAARTNVIVIMADDIGYECYGTYGSKQYLTPNIDRLAEQGMKFEHCYSQPLCTPSRIKIMSGISNVRNYSGFSVLNRDQRTIGQYFRDAGYRTMIGGKWQLLGAKHYKEEFREKGSWPEDCGFDEHCLWQVDDLGDRFWNPKLRINGTNLQFSEDDYGPTIVNDHILRFMEKNHDQPFLVYYPMILVHNPFLPTPDSEHRNNKDKQKNFEDMVAYMDKMIGRVAGKVDELGIADRTLILVTGDNGTNKAITSMLNGIQIKGGKGQTNDSGTRVALVARMPGTVPAGTVNSDLVDFSDFLPTTLAAAGAPKPTGIDGHSFWPQLQGQAGTPREWIYCYYNPRPERTEPARFARTKQFKLYGDGKFYEVPADVLEQHPLTELSPEAKAAKAKLAKVLNSFPAEGQTLLKFPE